MAVIVYATLVPHPMPAAMMPGIPHIDKLIHAIMFGGLAGALMFDFYRSGHRLTLRAILRFAAAVAIFGALDELAQGLMGLGRASDFWDLMADWFGVIVAIFTAPPVIKALIKRQ